MELKHKIIGVNNFLTDIYDEEMRLSLLLKKLHVSPEQISYISQYCLAQIADNYIGSVKTQLMSYQDGLHLYNAINHRYGFEEYDLDGLEGRGPELALSPEKIPQLEQEALESCRLIKNRQLWEDNLQDVAFQLTQHLEIVSNDTQAVNVKRSVDEKFAYLQELQSQSAFITRQKEELINQTIPLEIRTRLEEIEIEFDEKTTQINEQITLLENDIKSEVMLHGATVRSDNYTVVFQAGNRIWDSDKLKLYAKNHPEILDLRKQTKAYAIIKKRN